MRKFFKTLFILGMFFVLPNFTSATIIFEDNFDNQINWVPPTNSNCLALSGCATPAPAGWSYYWEDESWGAPTYNPSMQINTTNHRGNSGKGYTQYNESNKGLSGDGWGADGVLTKLLPDDYQELYAGMWVKFQPGWAWGVAEENIIKLFRILHYDRTGSPMAFFSDGNSAPGVIFDLKRGTWGWRNTSSFRCDPQETNYFCSWDHSIDQRWGTSPYPDYNTSGQIMDTNWHWLEMHVKMNTNINGTWQANGQYHLWLDDNLIASKTDAAFIESGVDTSIGWNEVGIGGNAFNNYKQIITAPYQYEADAEQWYAIDDVVISTTPITSSYVIGGGDTTPPSAPSGLSVQ